GVQDLARMPGDPDAVHPAVDQGPGPRGEPESGHVDRRFEPARGDRAGLVEPRHHARGALQPGNQLVEVTRDAAPRLQPVDVACVEHGPGHNSRVPFPLYWRREWGMDGGQHTETRGASVPEIFKWQESEMQMALESCARDEATP